MKNRTDLAKFFHERGFKVGAEVGVYMGDYAVILCENIPSLKYYGIDDWSEKWDPKYYKKAKERLSPYDVTLIKKTSMRALDDFEADSLDFVYIDAHHVFDSVINDLIGWTKKVKKGGIISGDDYKKGGDCGVIPAVNGYTEGHWLTLHTLEDKSWWFNKKWNT